MTAIQLVVLGLLSASPAGSAARFRGLQTQQVSPVTKVVSLLKGLQKQVEGEGKKEAAEYDKFSCWCKDTADNTLYNIETSEKKISRWEASVQVLSSEINEASSNIADFAQQISDLQTKITNDKASNEQAVGRFIENVTTMRNGLESIKGAIQAMETSKEAMSGNAKLNLAQVQALTGGASRFLLEYAQKPPSITYRSNDIIATLKSLKQTFESRIKSFEEDEHRRRSAAEMSISADERSSKIAADQKADEETIFAAKTEEKTKREESIADETKMKTDDSNFLGEVTKECQDRAKDWDARSQERSDELNAIAAAIEQLQTVSKKFSANKRLAQMQQDAKKTSLPTFLELSRSDKGTMRKVLQRLDQAATKLESPVLAALAAKVAVKKDHFVKVRGLIKDLIDRLEADALAEAAQKQDCDEKIKKQVTSRDQNNEMLEQESSKEAKAQNDIIEAKEAITEAKESISQKTKELADATELRTQSSDENTLTVSEAEEGLAACQEARKILQDFYQGSSLLQTDAARYVPPNANRDGVNVEDARPDIFEGGEVKNKEAGTNIIALLDVIISDFERTIDATKNTEKDEVSSFEKFESDTQTDISDANNEVNTQEGNKATAESDKIDASSAKSEAQEAVELSNEKLNDLKAGCIDEKVDYAERVKRRQQEIQALKDALAILESMGPST